MRDAGFLKIQKTEVGKENGENASDFHPHPRMYFNATRQVDLSPCDESFFV
jgi:hypothetical protein